MEWILLIKKRPAISQIVFALINARTPVVVKFSGEWFTDDGLEVKNITHWSNIPKKS